MSGLVIVGVCLVDGFEICVVVVVLMIGIFFCGVIYIGDVFCSGGCMGDKLLIKLVGRIDSFELLFGCLKIGILFRLDGCMIKWDVLDF